VLGLVLQPGERLDHVGAEVGGGHGGEVLEQRDDVGEALGARGLAHLGETAFDAVASQVGRPAQGLVLIDHPASLAALRAAYFAFADAFLPAGAPSCGQ
jgi:hypothetical protein